MQNAPRVAHIELPEALDVVAIESGPLFDVPFPVVRKVAALEFPGTTHGGKIEIERMDSGAHAPGRETEEPRSAADIQKCFPFQAIHGQEISQRPLRLDNSILVENLEEGVPVVAESK